jgi:hypothetical protein
VDAMFTIAPRALRNNAAQCFAIKNAPVKLLASTRFQLASESASTGPAAGSAMPALLTNASTVPKRSMVLASACRTEASSETSVLTKCTGPRGAYSASVSRPASSSSSAITTAAPSASSRSAMALPMP